MRSSFVSLRVLCGYGFAFAFPIPRDVGDVGDHGDRRALRATALCLCPSARDPTPPYRFVENKSQSAIRPNGHRTVEALFLSFLPVESVSFCRSFHPCNPLPTYR